MSFHNQREQQIIEFWEKNNIFEKSVSQRPQDKQYVFYDGPPFATGTPHYGHILGLTIKDVIPRYWTMKGFRVERRWGWDCHGLPIESIGEKDLNVSGKKEIEAYGVENFNDYCRSKVLTYVAEWKKTVIRMGKWIEFDNSYKTMDNSYIESVWWAFKRLYDMGFIYEGRKVLLFCPKSQTPISKFEIQMDNSYKTVTEKTATVAFKVQNKDNEYLLTWTTTPWTLLANVAIAMNTHLEYVKVTKGNKKYILAKNLVDKYFSSYDTSEAISIKDILGLHYERLYTLQREDNTKKGWYVIDGGDEVTELEGTGLVHMAPYGEFDYEMIKKHNLPFVVHLDDKGEMIYDLNNWKGLWFKDLDKEVLNDLDERDILFASEKYTHPYPYSPRYNVPLFYNPIPAWFINIQKIKKRMVQLNKHINWYPDHFKEGRFKHNMETAPDWNISRNRFWASSIPVWRSKDGKITKVIGSVKELQELATTKVPDNIDLHKHTVDAITIKDSKTGEILERIPEVFDCWFESASMPFAAVHYPFKNKEWFDKNFPADFISEYVGQVRAWFYVMHAMSVLLFDKHCFKNVIVSGNILAEDGSKMSKSKKNYPDPQRIFDEYGADALRFYLMSSPLTRAEDLNFNENFVKDVARKVVMILANVKQFYVLFAEKNTEFNDPSSTHILDKWIISETNKLIKDVTEAMDHYDLSLATNNITTFIDNLSTWYVRRSRDRFKKGTDKEKQEATHTLAYALEKITKVIAPIAPFIAESIYQEFRKAKKDLPESVHLDMWPKYDQKYINEEIHTTMTQTREVVSKILDEREKAKISIRQALGKVVITGYDLEKAFQEIIADEVNVKEIICKKGNEKNVTLDTTITPELLQEGIARDIVRKINSLRKKKNLTIKDRITLYVVTEDRAVKESFVKHKAEICEAIQADNVEEKRCEDSEVIVVNKANVSIGLKILN